METRKRKLQSALRHGIVILLSFFVEWAGADFLLYAHRLNQPRHGVLVYDELLTHRAISHKTLGATTPNYYARPRIDT
ncbi:hypothetical protein HAX54_007688 [Datura stramonium]|uniref:Uncharacterized protein n=1 Tax=Datura stramonium TaxID=4076 RepID=A0ABS8WXH5_DATST|nr:hypothetical protein [Datura stramonium]